MPTLRERAAKFLLGPELREIDRVQTLALAVIEESRFAPTPEQMLDKLVEQHGSSRVVYDLVQRLRYEATGHYGGSLAAARGAALKRSRLADRLDIQSRHAKNLWTDFGFGQSIQIAPRDPDAAEVWDEFFNARRNAPLLKQRKFHKLSDDQIVDGEQWFVFFGAIDGEATIRRLRTDQISEVVHEEGDADVNLFYVRNVANQKVTVPGAGDLAGVVSIYYPDWQATPKQLNAVKVPSNVRRADKLKRSTRVVVQHAAINEDTNGRGWPQFYQVPDYTNVYRELIQDWATVSKANAMYVRQMVTAAGSRGVDAIRAKFGSTLSSTNMYERNPPAVAGSTLVHNRAVEVTDVPLNRGAGDAQTTSMLVAGQISAGTGAPLHWMGRPDAMQNRATARETAKPFIEQMERYQSWWADVLQDWVEIVLRLHEEATGKEFETYEADISLESPIAVDLDELAKVMTAVTGGVAAGAMDPRAAGNALERFTLLSLEALGVKDAQSVLEPENGEEAPTEAGLEERWVTIQGKPVFTTGRVRGTMHTSSRRDPVPDSIVADWEGSRYSVARMALYNYRQGISDLITLEEEGETVGLASIGYSNTYNPFPGIKGAYVNVSYVATARRGYGRQTMNAVVAAATDRNAGIYLKSTPDAIGFYKAIGMQSVKGQERTFYLPMSEKSQSAKARFHEKAQPYELEPEDGVFVDSGVDLEKVRREGTGESMVVKEREPSDKVEPLGKPLADWPDRDVLITPEDVARAIRNWDRRMPPEAQGLLVARTATPEEQEAAVEEYVEE